MNPVDLVFLVDGSTSTELNRFDYFVRIIKAVVDQLEQEIGTWQRTSTGPVRTWLVDDFMKGIGGIAVQVHVHCVK